MREKLKITEIRYFETRRGVGYECQTNEDGVTIWNDGMGGITFIQGTWSKIKRHQHLRDIHLEEMMNEFEK
jgi:hypothetical protein